MGTQLDYVTGTGPVCDTGHPLLPQGTSGALSCDALAFHLVEHCCLSGPWAHLTGRRVGFSSHCHLSVPSEAGRVGDGGRVLGEAGIIAIPGQVCGHWAGTLQGDIQEGSLESHPKTPENGELHIPKQECEYHLLLCGGTAWKTALLTPHAHGATSTGVCAAPEGECPQLLSRGRASVTPVRLCSGTGSCHPAGSPWMSPSEL